MTLPRDLLLHPIRLRIVQALVGRPMKPLELLDYLGDVPQASLYRHIKQFEGGGVLQVVGQRPVRGGVERTYAVVEDAVQLGADDLEGTVPEDHLRYFSTFLGALMADYAAYLEHGDVDMIADRVGYRQVPLWLSDSEFDELVAEMGEAVRRRVDNEPGQQRRRRLFTTIVMPDDRGVDTPGRAAE